MSQVRELIADRYRLERWLGSGAMGVVWLATDERLQRSVAIKQLREPSGFDPARDEEAQQRAMREGRIAGRLQHSNVVAVHDVTEHGGLPVLVMEYLPSRSLADVLADQGTLAVKAAAAIGAHGAAALTAAHESGIVHRDVKPANVLLGDDDSVKITDFGIALAAGDVSVTQTGLLNGTPAYLAPEIARAQPPTAASDVFSLGATLYAALEGGAPFGADSENSLAVLYEVAAGNFPPAQHAGALEPLLARMMHNDPTRRPTSKEAGEALRAVANGYPITAPEDFPPDALTQPMPAVTEASTVPQRFPRNTGTRVAESPSSTQYTEAAATSARAATRRYRKPLSLLAAGVALVAIVFTLVLNPQRDSSTPRTAPAAGPADLERVVSDYYALLPEQPGNAWTRLGPGLQAQGQASYTNYWNSVASVAIIDPPRATSGNAVHVGIELRRHDGGTVREFYQLGMTTEKDSPLINSATLVRSEATAPPPPPTAVIIERPAPEKKGGDESKDKKSEEGKEPGKGKESGEDKKSEEGKKSEKGN